ncbi:hypothetical protein [Pseudomonas sp. TWP3-2]|uniref:hypothetical protein n=1 Tax=Pseudomonas sp. TWP3-2 TaxID=2804574 RepID=UPI003CE93945
MKQHTANIATVSIALFALGFSIWQGDVQRTHNHVSLEPRINAYYSNDQKADREGLYLINNGMGPAFVEKLEVTVDGKTVSEGDMGKFGAALHPLGLSSGCLTIGGPRPNDSFKVGEEIALIELSKNAPPICAFSALKMRTAFTDGLDFTVIVKSIYGDRFEYNFKKNIQIPL